MTGVEIRPAQETDRTSIRRVVAAAFGDKGEQVGDLVEALHAARRVELSLVAELEGTVVGHVQLHAFEHRQGAGDDVDERLPQHEGLGVHADRARVEAREVEELLEQAP